MKRLLSICLCLCLLLSLDLSNYASADNGKNGKGEQADSTAIGSESAALNGVSGDAIIKFKDTEKGKKKLNDKKKKIKKTYKHVPVVVAEQLTAEEWNELKQDPNVEYIEPNGVVRASEETLPEEPQPTEQQSTDPQPIEPQPTDPQPAEPQPTEPQPAEWSQIHAHAAAQYGVNGTGVKVAVFDTGINTESADLLVTDGVSFVPDEPSYDDLNGHGTAVASIIAAKNNEIGTTGVAPAVNLYAVKVLNQGGVGVYSQVIEAIDWAIERKIDIVSMSFAGYEPSQALEESMNLASANGVLLVAPVGNEGAANIAYPAKYESVIAVGAVNHDNELAYFSNTGSEVDLVAPGVDVSVLTLADAVETRSGTSYAVPFVTAALTLAKQNAPDSTHHMLRQAILGSTTKLGVNSEASFGSGLLNIEQLLGGGKQQPPNSNAPNPAELIKVLESGSKYSDLKPEEREVITSFYPVSEQLLLDCEARGMSLLESVQAASRIQQFGIGLEEFVALHERIDDLSKLDLILNENQSFLRNYAVTEEAKPVILELFIEGYHSVTIYSAYKVNQALDIPMASLVLKQDDQSESQLEIVGKLNEAEAEAAREIASVFIVNLSAIQNYIDTTGTTWEALAETLRKYIARQGTDEQGEGPIKAADASPQIPKVNYDKYVQAPFSVQQNGNESVEAGTGNLNYSMTNYVLSGRNGMDVQLGIRYDSSEAGLNDPDFNYSYSSYTDYDYVVTGGALAYYSVPGSGTGRWAYYDVKESTIGTYELHADAVSAANAYARTVTSPNHIGDGATLILEYYAVVSEVYDPSNSGYSETKEDKLIANTYSELQNNIGSGWSFGFSSIETDSHGNKYVHLSSGGKYKINITSTVGDSNLDKYTLKDIRVEPDTSYTNVQNVQSAHVLIYEGGTKEYFGSDGRLLARKDRFGNTIAFEHQVINGRPVISKITDTLGRVFTFTYTTDSAGKKLVVTLPGGKTIQYISKLIAGFANEYVLEQVIDQVGRKTTFQYDTANCAAKFSFFDKTVRNKQNNYACLKTITYPTNASTKYTYEKVTANLGNQGSYEYYRIKTREDVADSISYEKQTYTYTNNFSGYPSYSDIESLPTDFRYTMTVTDLNNKSTTMTFNSKQLLEKTEIKQVSNKIQDVVYVYNADRLPTSVATTNYNIGTTEAATKTESYQYDAWGGVTSYTDPLNHTVTYTYENNDLHRMLSETKYMNASTMQQVQVNYVSDTVQQVKSRHYVNGVDQSILTTYTYDPANHNMLSEMTKMQDGSAVTVNYEYGTTYKAGYLTRIYQSVKNVDGTAQTLEQKFTYDFNTGAVLTYTDGRQNTTEYQYDNLGRLRYIINPANPTVKTKKELVYDDVNNTVMQVNEMGNKLQNIYDRLGRLLKTQSYENGAWVTLSENHYNTLGLVDWTKDVATNQTSYQYDALGRAVKITNPDLTVKQIVYKDAWIYEGGTNYVQTIDEDKRSTWTYYNKNGLKISSKVIDTERYQYDDVGNLIQYTDNKGNVTTYIYDDLNRLIQVKNALKEVTSYTYDNLNRLTSTKFPNGSTRQTRYDEAGRVIEKTDESGKKEKHYYDLAGNLDKTIDMNGQSHVYVYDKRNQMTGVTSTSNGTTQTKTFSYNDAGQRLTATNDAGTWSYQYRTDNGALKRITYPDLKYVEVDDQKTVSQYTITDPFGLKIYYKNDKLGRLDNVSLNSTFSTLEADYSYTANGKLDIITYPNGTKQDFDYFSNDANQLQKVKHLNAAGTILNQYSYDYDANFNIKTIVEGTISKSFGYDPLNRIQTSTDGAESYTYDTQGNRLTMQSDNPIVAGEAQYQYDKWNQLTSVTTNGTTTSYKYDPDGLLYERVNGGTKTRYYYFDSNLIAEGTVNADGSVTKKASYIRGIGLIARADTSGSKAYYLTNGHGDVVEMRNSTGGVVNKYSYSLWGSVTNVQETVTNPFKYSGEFWDDTTGLQYLRARWYDPSIGRFINKDTYEGDIANPLTLNLYTYVGNNPLIYTDPSGHCRAGVDAGCYVDSNSPINDQLNDPTLNNNSELYKQYQYMKENYCNDNACRNKYTAKQKELVADSDSIRNSACLYADCTNGAAEFTGWNNGLPVIVQHTSSGDVKYNLAPIGLVQCNCFTAGTTVQTDKGDKPIEEVQVGDRVLSKSDETGELAYKEVVGLFQKTTHEIYKLYIKDDIIEVTGEHPFWLDGIGWTLVKDLSVGDLLVSSDGTKLKIEKIDIEQRDTTVYNFEVKDFNSYFVSNLGVWVHNCTVTESMIRDALSDATLKTQQKAVSLPVIQRYVNMLLEGKTAPPVNVDGEMLVDGNHRYIAGLIVKKLPVFRPWLGGRPNEAIPWDDIEVDSKDWGNK